MGNPTSAVILGSCASIHSCPAAKPRIRAATFCGCLSLVRTTGSMAVAAGAEAIVTPVKAITGAIEFIFMIFPPVRASTPADDGGDADEWCHAGKDRNRGLAARSSTETAESLSSRAVQFNAVLGFNYLHLVRDLTDTLRRIHGLLTPDGLFISKTPCIGDMNLLIRLALLPAMRAVGKAPYVSVFRADELSERIRVAGFEILATEGHATRGRDTRPYIVARKQ